MKKRIYQYLFYISLVFVCTASLTSCSDSENKTQQPGNNSNGSNNLSVGASAHDLLSADSYNKLVIEILYTTGHAPSQDAVDNLKTMLSQRLKKPEGITIIGSEMAAPGKATYTTADLKLIEDKNRTEFTNGNTIAAYFFFADGGFSEDTENSKVLGVAYKNTSMAIFMKTIEDNSGSINQPSTALLTSTVMNHEFGHILGLVNNGTDMESNHQDTSHGAHCNVEDCLMYWQAETSSGLANLLGMSSPPTFNAKCLADLKANGGE